MKGNRILSSWGEKSYLKKYLINCFGNHLTNKHTHLLGIFTLLQIRAKMGSSGGSKEVIVAPGFKFNPA